MMKYVIFLGLMTLSGCGLFQGKGGPLSITGPSVPDPAVEVAAPSAATALGAQAVRAEVLDKTTPQERAAALAAPASGAERALGRAVVALGPPAEQGIWVKTALVSAVVMGRVVTADGTSLAVELRPGTGGALLSLAAFQALGLPLTELPEVTVYGP
jgi:hypothetical protein